jgi:hypothetical protein
VIQSAAKTRLMPWLHEKYALSRFGHIQVKMAVLDGSKFLESKLKKPKKIGVARP